MNIVKRLYYRAFQKSVRLLSKLIKFPIPKIKDNLEDIIDILKAKKLKKPLFVVSNTVSKSERFNSFIKVLDNEEIKYFIYTGVTPDPTFKSIDVLTGFYRAHECDSIIAIGGGSVIDAAKAMGVLASYKKKTLSTFRGVLKVHKRLPYFIAAPTTAGTGSEATIASVVINEEKNDKFSITDGHLVPRVAILDDTLLKGLPKHIIAQTGMDAFTHAIEAYLGNNPSRASNDASLKSLYLTKNNLYEFYLDSNNTEARKNMLYASFYAGIALTRAYVGYVHALAHAVGGMYHIPHGKAIAILLPYVLEAYGEKAYKKMAIVSDELDLCDKNLSKEEKAKALISWIRDMNAKMEIPSHFDGLIKTHDLDFLVNHAYHEANPWYPVPKILDYKELKDILILANGK